MPPSTPRSSDAASQREALSAEQALNAIVSLLVAEREERLGRIEPVATELVLADSGLEYGAIAGVTGRGYNTVKSAVTRGREARTKSEAGTRSTKARKARS